MSKINYKLQKGVIFIEYSDSKFLGKNAKVVISKSIYNRARNTNNTQSKLNEIFIIQEKNSFSIKLDDDYSYKGKIIDIYYKVKIYIGNKKICEKSFYINEKTLVLEGDREKHNEYINIFKVKNFKDIKKITIYKPFICVFLIILIFLMILIPSENVYVNIENVGVLIMFSLIFMVITLIISINTKSLNAFRSYFKSKNILIEKDKNYTLKDLADIEIPFDMNELDFKIVAENIEYVYTRNQKKALHTSKKIINTINIFHETFYGLYKGEKIGYKSWKNFNFSEVFKKQLPDNYIIEGDENVFLEDMLTDNILRRPIFGTETKDTKKTKSTPLNFLLNPATIEYPKGKTGLVLEINIIASSKNKFYAKIPLSNIKFDKKDFNKFIDLW